jgi:hypothetical protein
MTASNMKKILLIIKLGNSSLRKILCVGKSDFINFYGIQESSM